MPGPARPRNYIPSRSVALLPLAAAMVGLSATGLEITLPEPIGLERQRPFVSRNVRMRTSRSSGGVDGADDPLASVHPRGRRGG
jgi:hypothetical protein